MNTIIKEKETALSGLNCFNCELYAKNITVNTRDMLSTVFGMLTTEAQCQGVREQEGGKEELLFCETYNCESKKDVEDCIRVLTLSVIC